MTKNKQDIVNFPIKVDSVSKKFKDKMVLNDISLEVKKGEIYGLIGVNGVGKTTLIKIILDLLQQDSGSVYFFGKENFHTESRNSLAYLPEKFQPSPFLKGKEFLSLSLSFHKKSLDLKQAREKAEILDLDPNALDLKINQFSKGMGQKLGLLAMFMVDAPLLILDEPMSGLDPGARIQLKELLMHYKKAGRTIFFSSHILADIEEICDRIAILHGSNLTYVGTPDKFLKQQKERNLERAFLKAIHAKDVQAA